MSDTSTPLADLDRARQLGLGRLLLMARRDFLQRCDHQMRENGYPPLSSTFVSVLPFIDLQGTRSTELAQRSGLTKQAVAKIVKQLEADGLLVREADPSDGRAFLVRFTPAGIERLTQTRKVAAQIEALYADLLGGDEVAHLRRLLMKIVRPADA